MKEINIRAAAAKTITQVIFHQQSLSVVLPNACQQLKIIRNQALLQELCYGSLRWYQRLNAIAEKLLLTPLDDKKNDLMSLIIVGLYQIIYTRIPHYAIVSETVAATKSLKKPWASRLINKVLRLFLQEKEKILNTLDKELPDIQYSHPDWLLSLLKKSWPDHWEKIAAANNVSAPLFLRINQQKISCDLYLKKLSKNHIEAKKYPFLNHCIQLKQPVPIDLLPGFKEGLCSVQDASGQHVLSLLKLKTGLRVLDACAAPGSKTSYILEMEPQLLQLTAIDKNAQRLIKIKENIERLQLNQHVVHLVLADACHPQQWWDGNAFDRILVDAPCSATGVIRRHPDIKVLKQKEDIPLLVQQQHYLLTSLWPLLKKGGRLLYSTCSVLPEENDGVIAAFLKSYSSTKVEKFFLDKGISTKYGIQFLPEIDSIDGFYLAVLIK